MKSQQNHSGDAAIVVPERGNTRARVVGEPTVEWSDSGRLAIAVSRGTQVPRSETLWRRVTNGQGRVDSESPWAGVAWDPQTRRLVAVRDPLGEVPLAWLATETRAVAGTSSAFVARSGGVALIPNASRLTAFCRAVVDTSDDDFIDDVRRVRPGEVVEIGASHVAQRFHWDSPDPRDTTPTTIPFGEAVDELERLIGNAVSRIEGPATLALSGGVDSALLATFLTDRDDVTAVHITSNRHPTVDEREWALKIAGATNLEMRVIDIDDIGIWAASPHSNPQAFPVSNLDRRLREEADGVLITGIGSDQLFSGAGAATLRHFARSGQLRALYREGGWDSTTRRAAIAGAMETTEVGEVVARLISSKRRPEPTLIERREPWMKADAWMCGRAPHSPGPLHRRWEWELVARNSWDAQGASCHPFLSPSLWRWAAQLGPQHRFHEGRDKAVVRALLARRNPEIAANVALRPKSQTFNAWAVDRLTHDPPPPAIDDLAALGIALPNTFRNRFNAFQRVARRDDANWGNFHVVALWRTLAAQTWVEALGAN